MLTDSSLDASRSHSPRMPLRFSLRHKTSPANFVFLTHRREEFLISQSCGNVNKPGGKSQQFTIHHRNYNPAAIKIQFHYALANLGFVQCCAKVGRLGFYLRSRLIHPNAGSLKYYSNETIINNARSNIPRYGASRGKPFVFILSHPRATNLHSIIRRLHRKLIR